MEELIDDAPGDWRHVPLGEVCDILTGPGGARLPEAKTISAPTPIIAPKDIRNNRLAPETVATVSADAARELARYRLSPDDVVVVRTGELGRQALIGTQHAGWLFGTACLRLRPKAEVNGRYLLYYLGHPRVRDWIKRNASGSTVPSLNVATVQALPLLLPPAPEQRAIGEILAALDRKVELHERIARTTSELRDSLLHPLLAGVPIAPL
jgi:restriction endonuclease S subunit